MLDIYDPEAYRDGIPYSTLAWLREHRRVHWCSEPELPTAPAGPGFWAVLRYSDVRHVSRETDIFSASLGATQLRDPDSADLPFLRAMLLNMDPPQHNHYRRVLSGVFTRQRLEGFDEVIGRRVDELVSAVRGAGAFDIVEQVTDELALFTLAHILGVPAGDRKFFFDWANRIIGYHDDEYGEGGQANPRSPEGLADMFDYAETLAEHRRRHPGDDLISTLVHARVGGRPLTPAEFQNTFFLLAVAGNDTTRAAMPGTLLALLEHPDQFAALRGDPTLVDKAVEEGLRFAPPVIHFRRTATVDTTLQGAEIRAGQKVVMFYPAANRDPRAFDRPDEFDITQERRAHATFGHGPHVCVAAGVARLQMRHLLRAVIDELPGLRLSGPVERLRSNFIAGIKRMPIEFDR